MLAGDKGEFAIEAAVSSAYDPTWVLGRLFVWASGSRIGDGIDGVSLVGCRNWCHYLATTHEDRRVPEFDSLSADEVVSACRRVIYEGEGPPALREKIEAADITDIWMDALENWRIYLFESANGEDRVVWTSWESGMSGETLIPVGTVSRVSSEFVILFDSGMARGFLAGK